MRNYPCPPAVSGCAVGVLIFGFAGAVREH